VVLGESDQAARGTVIAYRSVTARDRAVALEHQRQPTGIGTSEMKKYSALFALALIGFGSQRADAAPPTDVGDFQGKLTSVTVTDRSVQVPTAEEVVLELTFDVAGKFCTTNVAAGATYFIFRSDQPNAFDAWVKTAEAAFLAGKTVRFGTGKQGSATCYPWFLQMK
jgi:hypothetical protein